MKIEFDEEAIEFIENLPKELRLRLFDKIMSTKKIPFTYFQRLKGSRLHKLRVGDYRVLADIDDKIRIRLIGHRKNIYK